MQVTLSSLNRHAVATREDVGTSKARCLEKHFRQIVPEVCGRRTQRFCLVSGFGASLPGRGLHEASVPGRP